MGNLTALRPRLVVFPHLSQYEAAYRARNGNSISVNKLLVHIRYLALYFDHIIITPGSYAVPSTLLSDLLSSPLVSSLVENGIIITFDDGRNFVDEYTHFMKSVNRNSSKSNVFSDFYSRSRRLPRDLISRKRSVQEAYEANIGTLNRHSRSLARGLMEAVSEITGSVETEPLMNASYNAPYSFPDDVFRFMWKPYIQFDYQRNLYSYPTDAVFRTLRDIGGYVPTENYNALYHPDALRAIVSNVTTPPAIQFFDQCSSGVLLEARDQITDARLQTFTRLVRRMSESVDAGLRDEIDLKQAVKTELRATNTVPELLSIGGNTLRLSADLLTYGMGYVITLISSAMKINPLIFRQIKHGGLGDFGRWLNERSK